jgi:hypothetical protein
MLDALVMLVSFASNEFPPLSTRFKFWLKSMIVCNQSLGNCVTTFPHLKAGPCSSFVFIAVAVVVPLAKWMVLLFLFLFLSFVFLDAVLIIL